MRPGLERVTAVLFVLGVLECRLTRSSEFLHRVPRQSFDDPFNVQGSSFNANLQQQVRNQLVLAT